MAKVYIIYIAATDSTDGHGSGRPAGRVGSGRNFLSALFFVCQSS